MDVMGLVNRLGVIEGDRCVTVVVGAHSFAVDRVQIDAEGDVELVVLVDAREEVDDV